jgi:hypothetical protein
LRAEVDLNGTWDRAVVTDGRTEMPDEGWSREQVPGTLWQYWEAAPGYGWWRRTIEIPDAWEGQRVFLRLKGARYDPHVYVDGELAAERLDGWSPFDAEITEFVTAGSSHEIAVRCQDWSAGFTGDVVFGEDGPGELRGQQTVGYGGYRNAFGMWDDVALVARPTTHLTKLVIASSWDEKSLTLTGGLDGRPRPLWVRAEVLDGAETVLRLPSVLCAATGEWQATAVFPDVRPWSPEDPHLYRLRLILSEEEDGAPIDLLEQRFGFREMTTDGPYFVLNGVRRHLLTTSTFPAWQTQERNDIRRMLEEIKAGNNTTFRLHAQPWQEAWLDIADEIGLMIVVEAPYYTDSGRYAYTNPVFWENWRNTLAGMVWRDRNHPSLILWSIENEILFMGNRRHDPDLEKKLGDLGRFVRRMDPHHLITFEADLDPDGAADVIGLHYPREMPQSFAYPNVADWLGERTRTEAGGGMLGRRRSDFFWERKKPLYIGEFLWVPHQDFSAGAIFFGDDAYIDRREYHERAKVAAWADQILAYRRAGVSAMCPWTPIRPGGAVDERLDRLGYRTQKAAYEPVAAFPAQKNCRGFADDTLTRRYDVFNDSARPLDLTFRWELEDGGADGTAFLELEPAGYSRLEIAVPLPGTPEARDYVLRSTLMAGGERVHETAQTMRVEPRRALETPHECRIAVVDPQGTWSAKAAAAGLRFQRAATLVDIAETPDMVILAPGAWEALRPAPEREGLPVVGSAIPGSGRLAALLELGVRVLVLEQADLRGFPVDADLRLHAATMTFSIAPGHPVLEGLGGGDLKFWGDDHYVSRHEITRPSQGGGRGLVVSGGPRVLAQSAVVETPAGSGSALFLQALAGSKFDSEPSARRMLQNAIDYLAVARPERARTVAVATEDSFAQALRQLGVEAEFLPALQGEDLVDAGLLMLHGSGPPGGLEAAAGFARGGGTIYWHCPAPDAFAAFLAEAEGPELAIEPSRGPVVVSDRRHALLQGVSREDVALLESTVGWQRRITPDAAAIDRAISVPPAAIRDGADAVEILTSPPALASLPLGRGKVVVDCIRWDTNERDAAKAKRYASALLQNLGAAWRTDLTPDPEWLPLQPFEPVERIPYFSNNGSEIVFYSGGAVAAPLRPLRAGRYAVVIRARSNDAGGEYAQVAVTVGDGLPVEGEIRSAQVRDFEVGELRLPAGEQRLTLRYTNDGTVGGVDRNLWITGIGLRWVDEGG